MAGFTRMSGTAPADILQAAARMLGVSLEVVETEQDVAIYHVDDGDAVESRAGARVVQLVQAYASAAGKPLIVDGDQALLNSAHVFRTLGFEDWRPGSGEFGNEWACPLRYVGAQAQQVRQSDACDDPQAGQKTIRDRMTG